MAQSQQEANQTMLHKGNTGNLKGISSLGTDKHSPLGLRSWVLRIQYPTPMTMLWPRTSSGSANIFLVLDRELHYFSTYQDLRESPGSTQPSTASLDT